MIPLKEFSYRLPEELIAQKPLAFREKARLMVVHRKAQTIHHETFSEIGKYLSPKSLLIRNNSKVIPARLLGHKIRSGGKVEVFLLKKLADGSFFEVLMKPLKKIRNGDVIHFPRTQLVAKVVDRDKKIVSFHHQDVMGEIEKIGHMPLPPYVRRKDTPKDTDQYQTVYARYPGSVAAPTAGLHFTRPLMDQLKKQGHAFKNVTLHINYATFKPVEEADVREHDMHWEQYSMSSRVWDDVRKAKAMGRKIVAIGTTSCRVLESVAREGQLRAATNLFIYPGYKFRVVDALITNFHLPFSTLLMLVYAFGSPALMKKAYAQAMRERYRFYSYGDAMIII